MDGAGERRAVPRCATASADADTRGTGATAAARRRARQQAAVGATPATARARPRDPHGRCVVRRRLDTQRAVAARTQSRHHREPDCHRQDGATRRPPRERARQRVEVDRDVRPAGAPGDLQRLAQRRVSARGVRPGVHNAQDRSDDPPGLDAPPAGRRRCRASWCEWRGGGSRPQVRAVDRRCRLRRSLATGRPGSPRSKPRDDRGPGRHRRGRPTRVLRTSRARCRCDARADHGNDHPGWVLRRVGEGNQRDADRCASRSRKAR